jgi:hypothetical protein
MQASTHRVEELVAGLRPALEDGALRARPLAHAELLLRRLPVGWLQQAPQNLQQLAVGSLAPRCSSLCVCL